MYSSLLNLNLMEVKMTKGHAHSFTLGFPLKKLKSQNLSEYFKSNISFCYSMLSNDQDRLTSDIKLPILFNLIENGKWNELQIEMSSKDVDINESIEYNGQQISLLSYLMIKMTTLKDPKLAQNCFRQLIEHDDFVMPDRDSVSPLLRAFEMNDHVCLRLILTSDIATSLTHFDNNFDRYFDRMIQFFKENPGSKDGRQILDKLCLIIGHSQFQSQSAIKKLLFFASEYGKSDVFDKIKSIIGINEILMIKNDNNQSFLDVATKYDQSNFIQHVLKKSLFPSNVNSDFFNYILEKDKLVDSHIFLSLLLSNPNLTCSHDDFLVLCENAIKNGKVGAIDLIRQHSNLRKNFDQHHARIHHVLDYSS